MFFYSLIAKFFFPFDPPSPDIMTIFRMIVEAWQQLCCSQSASIKQTHPLNNNLSFLNHSPLISSFCLDLLGNILSSLIFLTLSNNIILPKHNIHSSRLSIFNMSTVTLLWHLSHYRQVYTDQIIISFNFFFLFLNLKETWKLSF